MQYVYGVVWTEWVEANSDYFLFMYLSNILLRAEEQLIYSETATMLFTEISTSFPALSLSLSLFHSLSLTSASPILFSLTVERTLVIAQNEKQTGEKALQQKNPIYTEFSAAVKNMIFQILLLTLFHPTEQAGSNNKRK